MIFTGRLLISRRYLPIALVSPVTSEMQKSSKSLSLGAAASAL